KDLNTYTISVNGTLTVTGVSKNVDLNLEVIIEGDLIKINGKKDILMTDFEIDPPKALLGTIKTGNEITITYKSVFQTN
ncbi:MAG: YceI family protein, partial [Winogradskyella sp.]|nr:YceI family protein [Winogradskyella sp.]